MHTIFVYGTLKQGFPNAHVMRGERVPGRFVTVRPWALYIVGPHHVPWLVAQDGQGCSVEGELYRVADDDLPALDRLESIGEPGGYARVTIDVAPLLSEGQRGDPLSAQVYVQDLKHLNGQRLHTGPLVVYTADQARLFRND